jgi:hypothetical protein
MATVLQQSSSSPVLAVLGNTTRVYNRLHEIASEMKQACSSKYRGIYNREVTNGRLPEREDCDHALTACFDLRDLYHPPEGSGLGVNEEGIYDS